MINTFNLEQNLLTFPSERDILTGGRRGVGAMEDGCLDGLSTCAGASGMPFPPRGQASAAGEIESCHPRGTAVDGASGAVEPHGSGTQEASSHRPLGFWSIPGREWQD